MTFQEELTIKEKKNLEPYSSEHLIKLGLIGWFSMLAIDFLLHAGLFASFYQVSDPSLLSPIDAFLRIPLGYISFLLVNVLSLWLMKSLNITDWRKGLLFGLEFGGIIWGALMLGMLSITTVPPIILLIWFLGQTVETGVASALIGAGLEGYRLRRLSIITILLIITSVVLTIAMQSLGLAPVQFVSI